MIQASLTVDARYLVLAVPREYREGRFVISFDANGNRTFEIVGTITDVCAELAA